jgi:hypothetical protein
MLSVRNPPHDTGRSVPPQAGSPAPPYPRVDRIATVTVSTVLHGADRSARRRFGRRREALTPA